MEKSQDFVDALRQCHILPFDGYANGLAHESRYIRSKQFPFR